MRNLIVLGMLMLGSLSVGAFADEQASNSNTANAAPQCMQIQVEGKATTACYNLSDEQIQNLGADQSASELMRRCELRCVLVDAWGRCLEWRRYCW